MLDEHCCKHEPEIAIMITDVQYTKTAVDKLTNAIMGNGKIGLSDRVIVIEEHYKNMPSIRSMVFYASIGGAMVTFSCGAILVFGKLILNLITGA